MPFHISQTTAEEIVGATDAVIQKGTGADVALIADFLTIPNQNALNAVSMAEELRLVKKVGTTYSPLFPYATYLVTGDLQQKAAVLRFILEEYQPYKLFKARLMLNNSAQDVATQVKAVLGIAAD